MRARRRTRPLAALAAVVATLAAGAPAAAQQDPLPTVTPVPTTAPGGAPTPVPTVPPNATPEPEGTPVPTVPPAGTATPAPAVPPVTTPTPTPRASPTASPVPSATAAQPAEEDRDVLLAVLLVGVPILLLLIGVFALALASRSARFGDRTAPAVQAWREAAWRADGRWEDFRDWLRLGR